MARVFSIVGYRLTNLHQPTLLSALPLEVQTDIVAFGRRERPAKKKPLGGPGEVLAEAWLQHIQPLLQRRWETELGEPSFAADFVLSPPPLISTALLDIDATLIPAAVFVACLRALAERAGVMLPQLEEPIVIVGAIAPDESLSCASLTLKDILHATNGIRAGCLIGPFFLYDPSVEELRQGLVIKPARTLQELLRITLGDDPLALLRVALERLLLFDANTQGTEARLWQETELRAAESFAEARKWLQEAERQGARSRIVAQALDAARSLVAFQATGGQESLQKLEARLVKEDYLLTAIWLLVRRSRVQREQRQGEEADQCLLTARRLQQRLPFADEPPMLLHQLGRSYYYGARYREALLIHWRGYGLLDDAAQNSWPGADFCNSAGKCFNDLYQLTMALELFEHAHRAYRSTRQDEKLAFNRGAMGEAYWRLGELSLALERCRENLEFSYKMDQARPAGGQPNVMRAKNAIAQVLFAQGQWTEAALLYEETERYYRTRYEEGQTRELGNLLYSLEGVARIAASRAEWGHVGRLVDAAFALAGDSIDATKDTACLPLALLAYLNAQRFRRAGASEEARQWLKKAEGLLAFLYQPEYAALLIEQLIVTLEAGTDHDRVNGESCVKELRRIQERLEQFLALDNPAVQEAFAPFRERLANGEGVLDDGPDLYAREQARYPELKQQFALACAQLSANDCSAAVTTLRSLQSFVVFFRDYLSQLKF